MTDIAEKIEQTSVEPSVEQRLHDSLNLNRRDFLKSSLGLPVRRVWVDWD
jgi:hypothetical protein